MQKQKSIEYYHKVQRRLLKPCLLACKVGLGSAFAVYLANFLGLESAAAAGTITLLTLVNTKWGTVRLIAQRFLSFFSSIAMLYVLFYFMGNHYLAFGIFLFGIALITEILGWGGTLSVNALIGMHVMTQEMITTEFIMNEFFLLTIGVMTAFTLNLFNNYSFTQKHLYRCIVHTDTQMQSLLQEVVLYLRNTRHVHPWRKMESLLFGIQEFRTEAQQFQDDTFSQAPQCFIDYFDMRLNQFYIIQNLHHEIRIIRNMPKQAQIIADYLEYMIPHINDHNEPSEQIYHLKELMENLKSDYHFESRTEFEDRAILYHILLEIDEFLHLKARFLKNMSREEEELFFSASAHRIFSEETIL